VLVVSKYLITQFVDKLVKAKIHLQSTQVALPALDINTSQVNLGYVVLLRNAAADFLHVRYFSY